VKDPIRIVEAAYAYEASTEGEWLKRVAEAVLHNVPVAPAAIAYAYEIQWRGPIPWVAPRAMAEINAPAGLASAYLNPGPQDLFILQATTDFHRRTGLESGLAFMRSAGVFGQQERFYREVLRKNGFQDALALKSADPTSLGCIVVLPIESTSGLNRATLLQWKRLAAHIAAGFRIRRKIAESAADDATHGAEAILKPNGAVAHATDATAPRSTRAALREAVLAADRARGPLRRRAPDEAIEVWRGLVAGRWTLLDHFDRDGRRYLVAHRNDPDAHDPRALTLRERQVVGYVALGQSNKLIAYELGLSESTIGVLVHRAAAKLGARSRAQLGMFGSHRPPGRSTDE
jgi:DNA-binding CsgD family transcriptional regulator